MSPAMPRPTPLELHANETKELTPSLVHQP